MGESHWSLPFPMMLSHQTSFVVGIFQGYGPPSHGVTEDAIRFDNEAAASCCNRLRKIQKFYSVALCSWRYE